MQTRYKIDVRVGCAAIVDSFFPDCGPGLHSDHGNVVEFIELPYEDKNPVDRKQQLDALRERCSEHNNNNSFTKERVEELRRNLTNAALELEEAFALTNGSRSLRDLLT